MAESSTEPRPAVLRVQRGDTVVFMLGDQPFSQEHAAALTGRLSAQLPAGVRALVTAGVQRIVVLPRPVRPLAAARRARRWTRG